VTSSALYNLDNARSAEQLADMQALAARGVCVFCPEQLRHDPDQPILHETEHWILTPNEFPYAGAQLHLLLVPLLHVEDVLDLPVAALQDFWNALGFVREHYQLDHYGVGMRNGDTRQTGATIAHAHTHILVSDPGESTPLRMRFNAKPH
jgi:ATP adenylyltransferase